MTHHASPRFWRAYRCLPKEIRELADRNYALLKTNSKHRSLQFKKIGTYWSVRVGLHYRALAVEAGSDLVWFWIGSHADYDKLLGHPSTRKPPTRAGRKQESRRRSGASHR